jgi:hypothetical protein
MAPVALLAGLVGLVAGHVPRTMGRQQTARGSAGAGAGLYLKRECICANPQRNGAMNPTCEDPKSLKEEITKNMQSCNPKFERRKI